MADLQERDPHRHGCVHDPARSCEPCLTAHRQQAQRDIATAFGVPFELLGLEAPRG